MIDQLPGFTERLPFSIDVPRLQHAVKSFTTGIFTEASPFGEWYVKEKIPSINLNHPPELVDKGHLRFFRYSGDYHQLKKDSISERDFTIMPPGLQSSYFGEVARLISEHHLEVHGTPMIGRMQLLWIKPEYCYKIHSDTHVMHRYHVPILTNPDCVWVFRDKQTPETLLHMPADGGIWWLNPTANEHTVVNYGPTPRLHMLLTAA